MNGIRAVLFDLDGVLIDATEWHYEALNRALNHFGYTISRFEHLTTYNGLPTQKKLEMLSVEKGLPRGLHKLIWQLKQKYTTEEIFVQCNPSFAKELMIKRLRRDGYRLGVCSNSIRASVELMLRGAGILDEFDFYLSNEDVVRSKPDPEIYLKAMEKFEVSPEQTVIIEDAGPGVQAAQRSKAHVCQVTSFEEVDYQKVRSFIDRIEGAKLC